MPVRLIDANAAADKIMRETENRADDLNIIGIALMIGIARMLRDENDFPTIEAEPVRHGMWIDVPDANTKVAKCSLCGFWQRTNGDDKTGKHLIHNAVYRYCAGCGARMDGGADNG